MVSCTAIPAAVLTIPNTMAYAVPAAAAELALTGPQAVELVRAGGLALPALLLAVPPAALAARRMPPGLLLLIGLALMFGGGLAARYAGAIPVAAAARAVQGAGAGAVLPASLVLAWSCGRRLPTALWAGVLAAALMLAMPLRLLAVPAARPDVADGWRAVLEPSYWVLGAVLAAAVALLPARARPRGPLPALRHTERTQLLLPMVPVGGFAVLAVMTTYGWSPGAQLLVGVIGLLALLGLAVVGSRDATTGSPLGFAVVALTAGALTLPVVAPLAGLAALPVGPRGIPPAPFVAGAAAAVVGALAATLIDDDGARRAILAGHGLALGGVCLLLGVDPLAGPWALTAPLVPLGAGIGLALAAALRGTGLAPALFGLVLCLPAVLIGQLVVLSLQSGQIQWLGTSVASHDLVYALTAGYRMWLAVAGVLAVVLAGAAVASGRHRRDPATAGRARSCTVGIGGEPGTPAGPAR
ncbi:hypothetical protein DPM19_34185 [Actinomadura craniellae]|uniref:MFS transporter n=1 Tax=Actinomadura craniellae TaxID=2231787 RepID=A0A365GV84_9ACTN|nr:hypothetical protein DPM19_34185 [Actinomadura craniellae]